VQQKPLGRKGWNGVAQENKEKRPQTNFSNLNVFVSDGSLSPHSDFQFLTFFFYLFYLFSCATALKPLEHKDFGCTSGCTSEWGCLCNGEWEGCSGRFAVGPRARTSRFGLNRAQLGQAAPGAPIGMREFAQVAAPRREAKSPNEVGMDKPTPAALAA
jgi:hypothetical protein